MDPMRVLNVKVMAFSEKCNVFMKLTQTDLGIELFRVFSEANLRFLHSALSSPESTLCCSNTQ